MIKSMRSLLEQPALKDTEENPDYEHLDSNDNEDLGDDDNGYKDSDAMVKKIMRFLWMIYRTKMKK